MIHPKRRRAFTLAEIMIVVGIVGLLVAIAAPAYIKSRDRSRQSACQENLLRIDGAVQQYLIQENIPGDVELPEGTWPGEIVGYGKYLRSMPICPAGGTYQILLPDEYEPVRCTIQNPDYPHRLPQILEEIQHGHVSGS